jgi:hypothetical protein
MTTIISTTTTTAIINPFTDVLWFSVSQQSLIHSVDVGEPSMTQMNGISSLKAKEYLPH